MSKSKQVSPLEVIRTFYIGDELLSEVFTDPKVNEKNISSKLAKILKTSRKLTDKELLEHPLDHHHPRYDNYINSKWTLKEVRLSDCGAWPRMGGLPEKATRGSIIDTSEFVNSLLKDKRKLTLKTSRVLYAEEMMKYAEEISKKVPIIAVEGGLIRNHKLRETVISKNHRKMKYDIDDGNHRALALALLGKKKVKAYVGKRVCKSSLIYH